MRIIGMFLKVCLLLLVVMFIVSVAQAQTTNPLGSYSFTAGYANVTGHTDNGEMFTFTKQFSNRGYMQVKDFLLSQPSGVNIASVGPRYEFPLSAIQRPNSYFDTSKWFPFVDGNVGVAKDTTGNAKLAYGIGAGLNYQAAPNVKLLLVEMDYYRSNILPQHHIWVTNVKTYTAGLTVTFGH